MGHATKDADSILAVTGVATEGFYMEGTHLCWQHVVLNPHAGRIRGAEARGNVRVAE